MHIYAITYLVLLHVLAIAYISYTELDFSKNIADIILGIIGITLALAFADLCFLIPSLFLIAVGTIISFLMAISVPVFLVLSLFQICGAESVDVLGYGFLKTLLFFVMLTPFGIFNLISLKFIIS